MPPQKSDLHIKIRIYEKEFTLNGKLMLDGKWRLKKGRSYIDHMTTTEIFKKCLHFISQNIKAHKRRSYD